MSVQNFECQIAKAQIGRYLAGDALSAEALDQLEEHIARCPDCKQTLAEKRASLQAMLGLGEAKAEPKVAAQVPEQQAKPLNGWLKAKAIEQFKTTNPTPPAPTAQQSNAKFKTAAYSVALAVVIVAMSYLSKNPNTVLGEKAIDMPSASVTPPRQESKPVTTQLLPAPSTESEKQSTQPTTAEKATEQSTQVPREQALAALPDATRQKPSPTEDKVTEPEHPAPKPAVTIRRSSERKPTKRRETPPRKKVEPAKPKPATKRPTDNTIRVYDADGNPIS